MDKKKLAILFMFIFSLSGSIITLFNFFLPDSPIRYTAGAELVILTTLIIAGLSMVVYFFRHSTWEKLCLGMLILALLSGTIFATWLLESWIVFTLMMAVLVCWIIQIFSR